MSLLRRSAILLVTMVMLLAACSPAAPSPSSASSVAPSVSSGSPVNPASGSFVSDTVGWVLGTTTCDAATCPVVVTTADGGATWERVASPATSFADIAGPQGSPRIRFANATDGWIVGAHLWATHDGAATWKQVKLPGSAADSQAADLVVTGNVAWLVALGGGADLLKSPVSSDAWTIVPQTASTATTGRLEGSGSVTWEWLTGQASDGSTASRLFATADSGATWTQRKLPCPNPGGIAVGDGVGLIVCGAGSAAGSQEKQAYLTHDNGKSFDLLTNPPFGGSLWGVGLRDASTLFVAAVSGATFLYGSSDAGATWSTVFQGAGGGANVSDLAFTSKSRGAFVLSYTSDVVGGQPAALMLSVDGGASWQPAAISAPAT